MPDWAQIISDALDILKFDGAVQDTLAELREKWGAQVPARLDERFDAVGVQYMKLSHEKGAAALGQELSAFGWALYNLDDEEVEGAVRIAHDEEQCRFLIAQRVQLQLIVHSEVTQLLDVEGG